MENQKKKIPVYELVINANQGLFGISLVNQPAIEQDFFAFSKEHEFKFKTANEEKRLITGLGMIPNFRMTKKHKTLGEIDVYFSKDSIRNMVRGYFNKGDVNKFNIEHSNELINGLQFDESYFISDNLKSTLFPNAEEGSWAFTLYAQDDSVWNDYVKTGVVKGFSIECLADAVLKFAKEDSLEFSNFPQCNITSEMVDLTEIKHSYIQEEFDSLEFSDEVEMEEWKTDCQCNNCKKLKSMGTTLKGVLPNVKDKIKTEIIK
jgi:hypothetical protein